MEAKLIGERIAKARKGLGMSQAQLGERLFVSPQAVGKWERGESVPDIMTIDRLAQLLELDLNHFSTSAAVRPADGPLAQAPPAPPTAPVDLQNKPKWDMSRGNWVDADFSDLKDLHEKFSSSNMKNCKFIGAHLAGLLLGNNHVEGCDFRGAHMRGSRLRNSHLANNAFQDCDLSGSEIVDCHIKGCNLSGADLTGAVVTSTYLAKCTITNATLVRTAFKGTHIADTVIEGALQDCSFEDCGFSKVTFRNARLLNTFFKGPGLKRIQFIDCHADRLTYEFLKNGKADVSGVVVVQ